MERNNIDVVPSADQVEIVNEYSRLYFKKHLWSNSEDERLDALAEVIRGWAETLKATDTDIVAGIGCRVEIGRKPIEKYWRSMAAVSKAAGGFKALLAICTVTFKALSGVIGNAAAEALQLEAPTGKRKLVAVAMLAEPKAA